MTRIPEIIGDALGYVASAAICSIIWLPFGLVVAVPVVCIILARR